MALQQDRTADQEHDQRELAKLGMFGNQDNDTVFGRTGNDTILAGTGNDSIFGNEGNDTIAGGAGADRYVFATGSGNDRSTASCSGRAIRLDRQGQTFTTGTSADGDVLLTLSGGGTIESPACRRRPACRSIASATARTPRPVGICGANDLFEPERDMGRRLR